MKNRKPIYFLIFVLLVLALILAGIILAVDRKKLKVIFFDVGQGDAILISQGKNQLLIDGGKSEQVLLEKIGRYVPFWDRKIETVLITHPDFDHIGGLPAIFRAYQVDSVIQTGAQSDSKTFGVLEDLIKQENSVQIEGTVGVEIKWPQEAQLKIIFPFESVSGSIKDTNGASLTTKLTFGQNSFLLTGDLPSEKELEILNSNVDIEADVLKVAHHGSKYSSSEEFLQKVQPQISIISVGKNSYGHPSQEILERLSRLGSEIWRTDQVGDVIFECPDPNQDCQRLKSVLN